MSHNLSDTEIARPSLKMDMGPYLRQEGRQSPRGSAGPDPQQAELRFRSKLGLSPAVARFRSSRYALQGRQPPAGITLWVSWLIQRVRRPE